MCFRLVVGNRGDEDAEQFHEFARRGTQRDLSRAVVRYRYGRESRTSHGAIPIQRDVVNLAVVQTHRLQIEIRQGVTVDALAVNGCQDVTHANAGTFRRAAWGDVRNDQARMGAKPQARDELRGYVLNREPSNCAMQVPVIPELREREGDERAG